MSLFNNFIPKEMFNAKAAFRLIKSKGLLDSCSLFIHQRTDFKKFEVGRIKIEPNRIIWWSKSIKSIVHGMARLTDDRGIIVGQKVLKPLFCKFDKGDIFRFGYHLSFTPRLLEYETLPKEATINGSSN